jgi:hypothetical protein
VTAKAKKGASAAIPHTTPILAKPLGWLHEIFEPTIRAKPEISRALFQIDSFRLHLIAAAVAHKHGPYDAETLELLLSGKPGDIWQQIVGDWPGGLRRALCKLPEELMPAESYRQLVELLRDKPSATFLCHRANITAAVIGCAFSLPPVLRRPAVLKLIDEIEGMEGFSCGLRILAQRAEHQFDKLAGELATLRQPEQIPAKSPHGLSSCLCRLVCRPRQQERFVELIGWMRSDSLQSSLRIA